MTIGADYPLRRIEGRRTNFENPQSDCDAAFSELVAAGAPAVTRPTTRSWGQRTAYVRDPDGNLLFKILAPDTRIPEPTAAALLGVGLLALMRRRR